MCAVSISGACGRFLRSCMRSYMFAYILIIFVSKIEGVGCDVVVLWIFLWCFSGFLLDFCLLWNDMIVCMIAYHFITLFACCTNAYTHIYIKSLQCGAVFWPLQATWIFMDTYGPWPVYVPDGPICLFFSRFFFIILIPKDIITYPHHWHNMMDLYYHHRIMYDSNPSIGGCL